MAGLRVTVLGQDQFKKSLQMGGKLAMDAIEKSVTKTTLAVHSTAAASIRKKGTGRTYKRGSVVHVASSAGSPPATDTGNLNSQLFPVIDKTVSTVEGRVISRAPYSFALEFGTRTTAARPFMRPALEAHVGDFREALAKSLNSKLNRI